jgi:hypothetical protein
VPSFLEGGNYGIGIDPMKMKQGAIFSFTVLLITAIFILAGYETTTGGGTGTDGNGDRGGISSP